MASRFSNPKDKPLEGKSIAAIAKLRGDRDPADTCFNLIVEEGGFVDGVHHNMADDDVAAIMRLPWVAIASDGSALRPDGVLGDGLPHPRSYGTNPRVLGKYVRDDRVLTLEDAIRKMTSLPAQILRLKDRGLLREGYWADLVVFDPARVADRGTYERPAQYRRRGPCAGERRAGDQERRAHRRETGKGRLRRRASGDNESLTLEGM